MPGLPDFCKAQGQHIVGVNCETFKKIGRRVGGCGDDKDLPPRRQDHRNKLRPNVRIGVGIEAKGRVDIAGSDHMLGQRGEVALTCR